MTKTVPKLSSDSDILYLAIFENAYRKYLRRIEFYAFGFVCDMDEANSIAQEAFTKLWEKRDRLETNRDLFPYLLKITRNSCLNFLRSKKHFNNYTDYRINRFHQNLITNYNTCEIFEKEVSALIDNAIKQMPDKVKETFVLSRKKGFKNKEIAQIQQINIRTVEIRISQAYRILRKHLKDYLPFTLWFFSY